MLPVDAIQHKWIVQCKQRASASRSVTPVNLPNIEKPLDITKLRQYVRNKRFRVRLKLKSLLLLITRNIILKIYPYTEILKTKFHFFGNNNLFSIGFIRNVAYVIKFILAAGFWCDVLEFCGQNDADVQGKQKLAWNRIC